MGDEFFTEMLERGPQSHSRAVAKSAERIAENALAERVQLFEVTLLPLSGLDPAQYFHDPVQPFAARRALAAGLVVKEFDDAGGNLDHAGRLVDHDHPCRTEH